MPAEFCRRREPGGSPARLAATAIIVGRRGKLPADVNQLQRYSAKGTGWTILDLNKTLHLTPRRYTTMSRAFVREHDGSDIPEDFPERPVSPHTNFVTTHGLEQIETRLKALEGERAAAKDSDDTTMLARIERDLRYWQQRKASARVVTPEATPERVRFGVRVALLESDGSERSYTLVGEDEADPAAGFISYISPLAQALLGKEVGDVIAFADRRAEIVRLS